MKVGLFFPTLALVEPGDEVIYPDPGFPTYSAMIGVAGGTGVPIPLEEDGSLISEQLGLRLNDDSGRLMAHIDPKGNRVTLTYTDGITLTRATGSGGQRWLDFAYDGQGRLSVVADHTGRHVEYGYDSSDNLTIVTDTLGQPWTYVYSGTHLLHEVVEPGPQRRVVERTFYDAQGRAVRGGLRRPPGDRPQARLPAGAVRVQRDGLGRPPAPHRDGRHGDDGQSDRICFNYP